MYKLSRIAEITGAALTGPDQEVSSFMIDSRSAQDATGTLFIAFRSGRNNAHRFIPQLVSRGFSAFLVEKGQMSSEDLQTGVSFLVSIDPLVSLQKLAAFHRSQFHIPVIAVTGSNGKTMVKEWLFQLLKDKFSICRSPKSYNSQIGVPLSLLNLSPVHTLGIFEAGISAPGEMEKLKQMIRPTIGVLTSLGSAHDEGFKDRDEKLGEKLSLFSDSEVNILHTSGFKIENKPRGKNILVGENQEYHYSAEGKRITLESPEGKFVFEIPFTDEASRKNAVTCAVVLKQLGFGNDEIAPRMKKLQSVALRLEIKSGIHQSLLINDFYNSDLDSLQIAFDFLDQQSRRRKKVVIASDIEQSGLDDYDLYKRVASMVQAHRIDLFIGIGERISAYSELFKGEKLFFKDTRHFNESLPGLEMQLGSSTILLKGARSFGFESMSRRLQQKSHDTVFEIDLNRLASNVNYYRSLLKPGVQLMCMVKAMGYGSGGPEIARTLQHIGVNYLAVAYADEGIELRESQVTLPVMVMNPEEDAFEDIIQHQLQPELYNFRVLDSFASKLDALGITEAFPVHIKIDTGMKRLGFAASEVPELLVRLKKYPQIRVQSVFSHLAGSEDPSHDPFTLEQLDIFRNACAIIEQDLGYKVTRHICNSAAISRFPDAHLDMVRLGIGMYGVGNGAKEQKNLVPVGTLKTRISQIRRLEPGETVGYGRRGVITSETSIAIIPIGYADGFSRLLGNGAHGVYVDGNFCKTVGNICMDMCMIDVTGIECEEGDEVIIFEDLPQLNALAKALQTITYEVLTNVSARVKRVYVQE